MSHYPQVFDAAYSISDIHLGGAGGFQIFNYGSRLGRFIDYLTELDAGKEIALVLNGDVIDSLAEDGIEYVAMSEDQASNMIERIMSDRSFVKVWDSLGRFVRTPRRHLIIVAGNHDIELGLPVVEAAIRDRLCRDDETARSRLRFSGRGAGYSCRVGDARVFFTHGNELDKFNRVDNEKLGQLALAQNAGRIIDPDDWTPNFGTRLVVDVMNGIKRQYPFVDLLKPETGAVYGVLLVMGGEALTHVELGDLPRLWRSHRRSEKVGGDLLNMEAFDGPADAEVDDEVAIDELLGPRMQTRAQTAALASSEEQLLRAVDTRVLAHGVASRPPTLTEPGDDLETLGVRDWPKRVWAVFSRDEGDKKEALRDALNDWQEAEGLFGEDAIEIEDRMSEWLRKRTPGAHFTVAGHTHKARSIEIRNGHAYYLNSGTWIRILDVPDEALEKGPNFDAIWNALVAGTMDAIDKATITVAGKERPLTMDFATAVHIESGADGVTGQIVKVGRSGPPKPVEGSQRTVRF